ncbi:MAG: hypothetical protein AAGH48_00450, partial [Pseudomonadota bacterium]
MPPRIAPSKLTVLKAAILSTALAVTLSGCVTVRLFGGEADAGLSAPQEDLRAIASQLDEAPWPEPERDNFAANIASVLLGGRRQEKEIDAGAMTRSRAVKAYLAELDATVEEGGLQYAVASDAQATLQLAAELTLAAEAVARAPGVDRLSEDVAVLEKAIYRLREKRSMYELILDLTAMTLGQVIAIVSPIFFSKALDALQYGALDLSFWQLW